jgi:hypothetical protein
MAAIHRESRLFFCYDPAILGEKTTLLCLLTAFARLPSKVDFANVPATRSSDPEKARFTGTRERVVKILA